MKNYLLVQKTEDINGAFCTIISLYRIKKTTPIYIGNDIIKEFNGRTIYDFAIDLLVSQKELSKKYQGAGYTAPIKSKIKIHTIY